MKLPALKEKEGLLLSHTNMRVQLTTISSLKKLWLSKCSPTGREGSECHHGSIRCESSHQLLVPTNCTGCRSHLLFKKMERHTLGLISFFFSNCKMRIITRYDVDNSLIRFNYFLLLLKMEISLQNLSIVVVLNFFTTAIIQKTLSESQVIRLPFFLMLWVF